MNDTVMNKVFDALTASKTAQMVADELGYPLSVVKNAMARLTQRGRIYSDGKHPAFYTQYRVYRPKKAEGSGKFPERYVPEWKPLKRDFYEAQKLAMTIRK